MNKRSIDEWAQMSRRVAEASSERFTDLVQAAGLDPSRELRFGDFSGVSFAGCNLEGFDLTGAKIIGCDFRDAKLARANLTRVVVDQVVWRGPAHVHHAAILLSKMQFGQSTDLTKAHDWDQEPHNYGSILHDASIRALWQEGLSASQIAARLGGITKSNVLKKIHRMGLREPATKSVNPAVPTVVQLDHNGSDADHHLRAGAIFQEAPCAPQMMVVPSGSYLQGDDRRLVDGVHRRKVSIGYRLAVGRFPTTCEEWDLCRADRGTKHMPKINWGRGKQPVVGVSWHDVDRYYLPWLNARLGLSGPSAYRLPSEAEWEYCCRAGTETAYSFGVSIAKSQAQFAGGTKSEGAKQAVEVGSFPPNAWGLHDMHGNVWEWCADDFSPTYSLAPNDGSSFEDAALIILEHGNPRKVMRGGAFSEPATMVRSDFRNYSPASTRHRHVGFRLARTLAI